MKRMSLAFGLFVLVFCFCLCWPLRAQEVYGYSDYVTDPYAGTVTAMATISADYLTGYYYGTQVDCWATDIYGNGLGHQVVGVGLPTASVTFSSQQQHTVILTGVFTVLAYFYGECGYYDMYNYNFWNEYDIFDPFSYGFYGPGPDICTEVWAVELGSVFTLFSGTHSYTEQFLNEASDAIYDAGYIDSGGNMWGATIELDAYNYILGWAWNQGATVTLSDVIQLAKWESGFPVGSDGLLWGACWFMKEFRQYANIRCRAASTTPPARRIGQTQWMARGCQMAIAILHHRDQT